MRFLTIYGELERARRRRAAALVRASRRTRRPTSTGRTSAPTRPTPTTTTPIANPEARLWAHLFNVRYRKLLVSLSHAFELADDPAERSRRARAGRSSTARSREMYNLRAIAGRARRRCRSTTPSPTARAPARRFRCPTR